MHPRADVVYIRIEDSNDIVYHSIVVSKMQVAFIKQIIILRQVLNEALILAQLLLHCNNALFLLLSFIHARTDSIIVLRLIYSTTCRFNVYVGHRIALVLKLTTVSSCNQ